MRTIAKEIKNYLITAFIVDKEYLNKFINNKWIRLEKFEDVYLIWTDIYETFITFTVNLKTDSGRLQLHFAYFPFIDTKRLYFYETNHTHGRPRTKKRKYEVWKRGKFDMHIRGFCSRLSRWLMIRLEDGFKVLTLKWFKPLDYIDEDDPKIYKEINSFHTIIFDRSGLDVCHATCLDMLIKQKLEEYKERNINPLSIQLYHSLGE